MVQTLEKSLSGDIFLFMPESQEAKLAHIEQLITLRHFAEAEECCIAILDVDKQNVEALFLKGALHFQLRSWSVAIKCFKEASQYSGGNATLLNNLGLALLESARNCVPINLVQLQESVAVLQDALLIKPDYAAAWRNLGMAFRELGDTEGARTSFTQALKYDVANAALWCSLGKTYEETGDSESARSCFVNGLSHDPANSNLWLSLGAAYTAEYYFDRAIECYRRVLQLNPDDPAEVYNRLATLYCYLGKIPQSIISFQHAVAVAPIMEQKRAYEMNRLFTLHYVQDAVPEEIASAHIQWGKTFFPTARTGHYNNNADPQRRLKIGYVSPDLRMNAVLFFIQPVLASHDPAQVEVFCYANVAQADSATEQLREHFQIVWRDIVSLDDEAARQLIMDDQIDILVDLTGHGGDNRLPLFGLKPAPIQVTWIGYPDTTGLPAMDYRITDERADPSGMTEHLHTEQLIRMPGCFLCYRPGAEFPVVGDLPLERNGYVTFGTMNNFSKINGRMIDVWCEILRMVPDSRLMIRYRGKEWERINGELAVQLAQNGIAAERLILLGHASSVVDQMLAYQQMDISLDTFPYNGTTTTFEALYMGVPVVTLAGRSHVARVGASILHTLALGDLVAENEHEYIARVVALAGDIPFLAALRNGLRSALLRSSLCDGMSFTRHLEQAYRQIWQKWCSQQQSGYFHRLMECDHV